MKTAALIAEFTFVARTPGLGTVEHIQNVAADYACSPCIENYRAMKCAMLYVRAFHVGGAGKEGVKALLVEIANGFDAESGY